MNVQTTKDVATRARRMPQRPPIVRYFGDIWDGIATTFLGMRLTIGYFFRKPVTMRYPEVRPVILPGHRGLHTIDESKCTLCHLCQNNCPVNCITVEGLGRARDTLVTLYEVDYAKCLFCNICAEVCPTQCVWLTEKYNLAAGSRDGCRLRLARPKSDDEVASFKVLLAQKEAERKARMAQKEAERKAMEQQQGPKPE